MQSNDCYPLAPGSYSAVNALEAKLAVERASKDLSECTNDDNPEKTAKLAASEDKVANILMTVTHAAGTMKTLTSKDEDIAATVKACGAVFDRANVLSNSIGEHKRAVTLTAMKDACNVIAPFAGGGSKDEQWTEGLPGSTDVASWEVLWEWARKTIRKNVTLGKNKKNARTWMWQLGLGTVEPWGIDILRRLFDDV